MLAACRHLEPEKRSTEAQIRQYIAGQWTLSESSDGFFLKIILGENGECAVARPDGRQENWGAWECQGSMLKVTRSTGNYASALAAGWLVNEWDWYPIIYVDAHELIMAPGISVAGRLKLTRQSPAPQ
ncbi:MAG: hypothetical protein C5B50_11890 [Verrucomicrobia bacterium]|nr:MAG: hypothetical protein C5B50_11890 [Verrucomicrobiota bacterium]